MSTTSYYTATSLDGFIADDQHSLDWLAGHDQDATGPLNYDSFIARIGAMVMGSSTYEWILGHAAGEWPYQVPTWVMTSRELPRAHDEIRFAKGDIRTVHHDMIGVAEGKDLWVVGGGELAGQFADADLLDEIIVYIAPVTLGHGAPLLPRTLNLELRELARNKAFACARYGIVKAARSPTGEGGC